MEQNVSEEWVEQRTDIQQRYFVDWLECLFDEIIRPGVVAVRGNAKGKKSLPETPPLPKSTP